MQISVKHNWKMPISIWPTWREQVSKVQTFLALIYAGANLKGADLRGAILTGANLLVTDLNGAILNGANLFGARNLTSEQFNSAIFNHETQIDLEQDITRPRIARIHFTDLRPSPEAIPVEFDSTVPTSMQNGKAQVKPN